MTGKKGKFYVLELKLFNFTKNVLQQFMAATLTILLVFS
jgi:hypothetical protein